MNYSNTYGMSVFSLLIASFVSALFLILVASFVGQLSGDSKKATDKSYLGVRHTMLKNRLKQLAMPSATSRTPLADAVIATIPGLQECFNGKGRTCDTSFNKQEFPLNAATLGINNEEFNLAQRTDQIGRVCAAAEPASRCSFENQVSAAITCSTPSTCEGFELRVSSILHDSFAGQNIAVRTSRIPMSLAPSSYNLACTGAGEVLTSLDVKTGQFNCNNVELNFCQSGTASCEVTFNAECPGQLFNGVDANGSAICRGYPTYTAEVEVFSRNVDFLVDLKYTEEQGEATLLFIVDNSPSMVEEIDFIQQETENMIKNLGKNAARIVLYTTSSINSGGTDQRLVADSAFQIIKKEIDNKDIFLYNKGKDAPSFLAKPAFPMESRTKTEIYDLALGPPVLDVRVPPDEGARAGVLAEVTNAFSRLKANLGKGSTSESAFCTLARIVEYGFGHDESIPGIKSVLNPEMNLATIILSDNDDYLRRKGLPHVHYACHRRLAQTFSNFAGVKATPVTDVSLADYGIYSASGFVASVQYSFDIMNFETGELSLGGDSRHFPIGIEAYPEINAVADSCPASIKIEAERFINDFIDKKITIEEDTSSRRHHANSAKCVKILPTSYGITLPKEQLSSNSCTNSFTTSDGETHSNVINYMNQLRFEDMGNRNVYRTCSRTLYDSKEIPKVSHRTSYLTSVQESLIDQIKILEPNTNLSLETSSLPTVVFKRMKQLLGANGFIFTSLVPTPFSESSRELASDEGSNNISKEAWEACLENSEINSFYRAFNNPWTIDFFPKGPEAEAEGFDSNTFDHAQYYVQAMSTRSGLSEIQGKASSVCDFSKYTAALDRFVELLKEPAPQEFSMESDNTLDLEFVKEVHVVHPDKTIEHLEKSQYRISGDMIHLNEVPLEQGDIVRVVLYTVQ